MLLGELLDGGGVKRIFRHLAHQQLLPGVEEGRSRDALSYRGEICFGTRDLYPDLAQFVREHEEVVVCEFGGVEALPTVVRGKGGVIAREIEVIGALLPRRYGR